MNLTILNKALSSFKVDLLANFKIEPLPGLHVDPSPPLAVIEDDVSDATSFLFRYDGKSLCVPKCFAFPENATLGLDGGSGLQEVCM